MTFACSRDEGEKRKEKMRKGEGGSKGIKEVEEEGDVKEEKIGEEIVEKEELAKEEKLEDEVKMEE